MEGKRETYFVHNDFWLKLWNNYDPFVKHIPIEKIILITSLLFQLSTQLPILILRVVYTCSSLFQVAPRSRDLSQAEKILCKMSQFTTILPWQFWVSFSEFAQLYMTVILFSAWDKWCNPWANWGPLRLC